jgi:hypothetical protein
LLWLESRLIVDSPSAHATVVLLNTFMGPVTMFWHDEPMLQLVLMLLDTA